MRFRFDPPQWRDAEHVSARHATMKTTQGGCRTRSGRRWSARSVPVRARQRPAGCRATRGISPLLSPVSLSKTDTVDDRRSRCGPRSWSMIDVSRGEFIDHIRSPSIAAGKIVWPAPCSMSSSAIGRFPACEAASSAVSQSPKPQSHRRNERELPRNGSVLNEQRDVSPLCRAHPRISLTRNGQRLGEDLKRCSGARRRRRPCVGVGRRHAREKRQGAAKAQGLGEQRERRLFSSLVVELTRRPKTSSRRRV